MTFSPLPKDSLLPRRKLSPQERQSFIERRDRIYSLCTPSEQKCLLKLAHFYDSYRHELVSLGRPSIFAQSSEAVFYHRYFPWKIQKPSLAIRGLAEISILINKAERWHAKRSQAAFISYLSDIFDKDAKDVLLGVIQFCLALPLEIGWFDGQRAFEDQLNALAAKCISSDDVSALRRFEAAQRCIQWEPQSHPQYAFELRNHMWRLLFEVAHEDMSSALALIDEHWNQTRPPQIFISGCLHETPELAYQLAVKLKPHRREFAADMLCQSIFYASFQLEKVDQPSATLLEKVMDASCRLLADWTSESPSMDSSAMLRSIAQLFWFGNPDDDYWKVIPRTCLAIINELSPAEQDKQLHLLAQIIFYESSVPSLVDEAQQLFQTCVARRLSRIKEWEWSGSSDVGDVCRSLSILEDKTSSVRNRHIAAHPNHFLLFTVEKQLEYLLDRLVSEEPSNALKHIVSLLLALSNENLIRKFHQLLREEFEVRARNFPADAGIALMSLIQYCGYSQSDDEMYRKELCEESFQVLLPALEGISPSDAAIARTGIGWSPRGNI